MRHAITISLGLLLFYSCNNSPSPSPARQATDSVAGAGTANMAVANDLNNSEEAFQISDWVIDEEAGKAMIEYRNCNTPACRSQVFQTYNKPESDSIVASIRKIIIANGCKIIDARLKEARYRDEDEARYIKARHIPPGSEKGKVSGYTTRLYFIKLTGQCNELFKLAPRPNKANVIYLDTYTICAPPTGDCRIPRY